MQIKARLSGILIWIIGLFLLLLPAMFFSQSEGQIIIGRDINFVLSTAIVIILVVCSPIFERDSPRAPRVFSLLWGLGSIWSALINLFLAGSGNDQLILAAQSWGNETRNYFLNETESQIINDFITDITYEDCEITYTQFGDINE